MSPPLTRAALAALDAADPLAAFRNRFTLPPGVIYMDGNSLGALPNATPARVAEVVATEWGQGLIGSWNHHGWIDLASRVGEKIGRLIGAPAGCTVVADSTSLNVFKALAAALELRPGRRVILSQRGNFQTDLYMAQGLIRHLGGRHELRLVEPEEIPAALDDTVAVLLLTHVDYLTGRLHDMAAITRAAHAAGVLTVWDLAHSAGAVPVDLAAAKADFAVGCGYKFLNGGPGAPAFFFAAPHLHAHMRLPLTGWLGHAAPFDFDGAWRPAAGIAQAIVGTPPILSLCALEVGVDIALEAPMAQVRKKSLRQTALLAELVEQECAGHGFRLVTPRAEPERGSQVSLAHPHAYPIMQALIAAGVTGDFRTPDILRFGITPLYLGYAELWDAVRILRGIMQAGTWRETRFHARQAVT